MATFPFPLMATAIGSMPHTDPDAAVDVVLRGLPELPAWPQLVRRSPLEGMAPQFAQGISAARVEGDQVVLEGIPGEHDTPVLTAERAAGFYALLQRDLSGVKGVKGQVTGPLTFASLVTQERGRPVLEDLRVTRRLAQMLGRLGEWQELHLRRASRQTLIFLDEPLLSQALANPKVGPTVALDLLSSILIWLRGPTGLHCCAAPDWDFLAKLPLQVISFDAYRYGVTTEMAVAPIRDFLGRGGAVAWGVVPTNEEALAQETVDSLADLVARTWGRLVDLGVPRLLLERQALITPACGLANMTPQGAERALALAGQIAARLRQQAGLAREEAR